MRRSAVNADSGGRNQMSTSEETKLLLVSKENCGVAFEMKILAHEAILVGGKGKKRWRNAAEKE